MRFFKKFIKKIILVALGLMLNFFLIVTTLLGACALSSSGSSSNSFYYGNLTASGCPQELAAYFDSAAQLFNIPNWVLAAVAKQESNFNPNDSYGGAYGLMQIQKHDFDGTDLWKGLLDSGLNNVYTQLGYSYSSSEDMWDTYLKDPKVQIIAGAYELRYYFNYVLYRKGLVGTLDYNSTANMGLINWNADANDSNFKEILRRTFACYNGGPSYGMRINLDNAQSDYPNKVYSYCMQFRGNKITGGITEGSNQVIETALQAGMLWVGKSPYNWGAGRTLEDIAAGKFDCSSFVHYCYSQAGINLGEYSSVTTYTLVGMGQKIDPNNMKRGDLIFFDTTGTNGHIGIYLGDNKFLHDGSSNGVSIGDLTNSYYKSTFNGQVRRIIQ